MNTVITGLKVRVVKTLKTKGPLKFNALVRKLRVLNEKRLDNVLQDLRRTGQIHFTGPIHGWTTGRGPVYEPNQRFI